MKLRIDREICPYYEEYEEENLQIRDAGCCGMFDVGWVPCRFDPCIGTYQKVEAYSKYYVLDYVMLTVDRWINGYFIGIAGWNDRDTPYSRKEDQVYDLWDLCVDELMDDTDTGHLDKLFAYLLRHCANNHCRALQIRMDDPRRYQLFYDHCKTHFGMEEWNGYLYLKIG